MTKIAFTYQQAHLDSPASRESSKKSLKTKKKPHPTTSSEAGMLALFCNI